MLRLTRGALTMLLAEYRSVLKNAYLKNAVAAAVAVSAAVVAPAAYAEDGAQEQTETGKDTDTKLCDTNDGSCTLEAATISKDYTADKKQYGSSVTISGGTNTLNSGSSLNATDGDIKVTGGTTTMKGATLNANEKTVNISGGELITSGTDTLQGKTVTVSGGTLTNSGTLTVKDADGNNNLLTVSKGATLNNNGTLNVKSATLNGTTNLGDSSAINADETITATTVNVKGTGAVLNGTTVSAGGVTVDKDKDLTIKGTSFQTGGNITNNGTLTVSSTEATLKNAVSNAGTMNLNSATTKVTAGTIANTGSLTAKDITMSAGTVTNKGEMKAGAVTLSGGTIENTGTEKQSANLNFSSLAVNGASAALKGFSNLTSSGDVTLSAGNITSTGKNEISVKNLDIKGGKLIVNSGSELTADATGALTLEGSGAINNQGTLNVGSTTGSFAFTKGTLTNTGTLNLNAKSNTVSAGFTNAGTVNVGKDAGTFTHDAGTITNNGTIALDASTVNVSGTAALANNNTVTVSDKVSNLNVSGGTITNNAGKTLDIDAKTTTVSGGTITNKGTLNLGSTDSTNAVNMTAGSVTNAEGATVNVNATTKVNGGTVENAGDLLAYEDLTFGNNTLSNTGTIKVLDGNTTFNAFEPLEVEDKDGKVSKTDGYLGGKLIVGTEDGQSDAKVTFNSNTLVQDLTVYDNASLETASGGGITMKDDGNFSFSGKMTNSGDLNLRNLKNTAHFGETAFNGTNVKNTGTITVNTVTFDDSDKDGITELVSTGKIDAVQLIADNTSTSTTPPKTILDVSGNSTIIVGPRSGKDGNYYTDSTDSLKGFTDVNVTGQSKLTVNGGIIKLDSINVDKDSDGKYGTFELKGNKTFVEGSAFTQTTGNTPMQNKVKDVTINSGTVTGGKDGTGLQLNGTELGITGTTTINAKEGISLTSSTLHINLNDTNNETVKIDSSLGKNAHAIVSDKESGLQYYNDSSVILVTGVTGGHINVSDLDQDGDKINDLGDIYEKLGIGESSNTNGTRQTINDDSRALLDIRDANGNKVIYDYENRHTTANGTTAIDIKDILDHKSTNTVTNVATAAAQTDAFVGDRVNDITKDEIIDQKLRVGSLNAQSNSTQVAIDANVKLFHATVNNAGDEAKTADDNYQGVYAGETNVESRVFVSRTNSEGDAAKYAKSHTDGNGDGDHLLDSTDYQTKTTTSQNADGKHTNDSMAEAEKLLGVNLYKDAWLGLYNGGAIGFVEAHEEKAGTLYITGGRTLIKTDDRADTYRSDDAKSSDAERKSGIGTSTRQVGQVTIDRTEAVVEDYRYQNSDTTKNADGVRDNLRDSYTQNLTITSLDNAKGSFTAYKVENKNHTSLSGKLDVEDTYNTGSITSIAVYKDSLHRQFKESSDLIVKNDAKFKESSDLIVKNDAKVKELASLSDTNTVVQDVNGTYRSFTAGTLTVTGTQDSTQGANGYSTIEAGEITTTSGDITIENSKANAYGGKDADGNETKGNISSAAAMTTVNSKVDAEESITSKGNMSHTDSLVTADQDITSGGTFLSDHSTVTAENGDITSAQDMTIQNGSDVTAQGKIDSEGALTATDSKVKTNSGDITAKNAVTIDNSTVSANDGKNDLISESDSITVQNKSTVTAKDVTAAKDVTVDNSKVTATNNVTATAGSVTAKNGADVSAVKVEASENVTVTASTVKASDDITAGQAFSATEGSTVSGKNVKAGTSVTIDSSNVTSTEDVTAGTTMAINKSTVTTGGDLVSSGKDAKTGASMTITGSTVNVSGDVSSAGNTTLTSSTVKVTKGTVTSEGDLAVTDSSLDTKSATVKGDLITDKGEGTKTTYIKTTDKAGITVDGDVTVGAGTTVATEKLASSAVDGALKGDLTVGGLLDVEEDLTIGSGTTTVAAGGTLDGNGKITSSGPVDIAGTATAAGDFTTGKLTVSDTGSMTSKSGDIQINGTATTEGKISAAAGSLTATDQFTMNGSASTTVRDDALFKNGLTITSKDNNLTVTKGDLTVEGKEFVLQNGATVNVNTGNATFDKGADITGNLSIAQTITVNDSQLKVGQDSVIKGNKIDLNAGGTVDAGSTITSNTTITSADTLTVKDSADGKTTTITAKEIDVTKGDLDIGNNNKVTATDGINVDTGSFTVGQKSEVTTSEVTVSTGDMKVEDGASVTTKTIEVTAGKLDVGDGATVTASGDVHAENGGTVEGDLNVAGTITSKLDFKVEDGGNLTAGNGNYDKNLYIYGISDFTKDLVMDKDTSNIDIYVGYKGESGILTANRLYLNTHSLFIDPDFSKDASIVGVNGFGGDTSASATTLDGKIVLGQNSILAVGSNNANEIRSAVKAISETEITTTTADDGTVSTEDNTFFDVDGGTANAFKEKAMVQNMLYLNKSLNIANDYAFYSENTILNQDKESANSTLANKAKNDTFTWGEYTGITITKNTGDYVNADRVNRGAINLENGALTSVSVVGGSAYTVTTTTKTETDADGNTTTSKVTTTNGTLNGTNHILYISGNWNSAQVSRFPVFNTSLYNVNVATSDEKTGTNSGTDGLVTSTVSTSYSGTLKATGTTVDETQESGYTQDSYIKKVDNVAVKFVNNSYYDWSNATVYLLVDGTLSVEGIVSFNGDATSTFTGLSTPSKIYVGNALRNYEDGDGLGAQYIYDRAADSLGKDVEATSRLAIFGGAYQTAQAIMGMGSDAALGAVGFGGIAPDAYIGEDYALWAVANYNDIDIDSHSAQGVNYGIDIDLMGLTIGADHLFEDGSRMGVFASVGLGTSEGKDAGSTVSNDFDYFGFGFYGKKTITENFDILGDLYMMRLSSDLSQEVPDENYMKLKGDADMTVVSGSLFGKYTFHNDNKIDVAPYAGIILSRYDLGSYEVTCEKGTIAEVSDDVQNVISFPVGVTISGEYLTEDKWTLKPIFDARLTVNAGNRDVTSNVTFTGVEGSETLKSQVLDDITYGGVLKLEAKKGQTTVGVGVNYTGSKNMDNYGVTANIRYQF